MNNKLIILLLMFVSLFCFNSVVYANETNGNVIAKYKVENGSVFYEETLDQNNEISIELEDRTLDIKSNSISDNGKSIIMIPVTSDAFEWLTSDYEDKTNLSAYYIDFYDKDKKTSLDGDVNIKIDSCESCDLEKVYFYDLNKKLIDNTNNANNDMDFNINKSGYVLFRNNVLRSIDLDISSNGDLVLDNKAYGSSTTIYSDSNIKEIAIRPDAGYVIDKIILNGNDITDKVSGNFVELNLNDTNDLKVTFKKETVEELDNKLKIEGNVSIDGKPVANTRVKLHNSSLVTYTDSEGNFTFDSVDEGEHTVSFGEDDNVIGYTVFKIIESDTKDTNVSLNDDVVEIEINNKSKSLNLNFDLEDDMKVNYNNVYTIIKGDVNCDGLVNVTDLAQLRMYLAGLRTLTDRGLEAADIKEDNKIDITDLIKLRRFLAGLENI